MIWLQNKAKKHQTGQKKKVGRTNIFWPKDLTSGAVDVRNPDGVSMEPQTCSTGNQMAMGYINDELGLFC